MRKLNIVVVDDNILMRFTTSVTLKAAGFNLLFDAVNGVDLINKLCDTNVLPDVCVLDINMPLMNGFEAARAVKAKWPDIKILAFSSNEDHGTLIKMLQNGADGYIVKGKQPVDLKVAVTQIYKQGYYFNDWICHNILGFLRMSIN